MGKSTKARLNDEPWTEKFGCDGKPPLTVVVDGIPDAETKARTVAKRNTNHCTICRLAHLGHLKDRAGHDLNQSRIRHAAAERLQDDFAKAGLSSIPSTLASLAAHGSGASARDLADMKIDASRRLETALRIVGTSGRFLLEKIALEDWTIAKAAQILRTKDNAVLPALRVALDALAQHYGMTNMAAAKIRGGEAQSLHPFNRA